jgi:hypothetical protein
MKSKIITCILEVLLSLFGISLLYLMFLAFYPYEPVRIDKFLIDKPKVSVGEKLCFQFAGEKFHAVPVEVSIELMDGENYFIMSYDSNNPVGCVFKKRCFIIPYHVEPGKYRLRWTGIYVMNMFNHIRKTVQSDMFEVEDE